MDILSWTSTKSSLIYFTTMQVNGKWDKGICWQVFKGCLKSGGVKHGQKDASFYREKKEMEIYEQKAKHIPAYRQQCRAVKPRVTFLPIVFLEVLSVTDSSSTQLVMLCFWRVNDRRKSLQLRTSTWLKDRAYCSQGKIAPSQQQEEVTPYFCCSLIQANLTSQMD